MNTLILFYLIFTARSEASLPSLRTISNGEKSCPHFLNIFLGSEKIIHRYQNNFILYKANGAFIKRDAFISHTDLYVSDGATINANDLVIGKTVTDTLKRKWIVTDVTDRTGRVRLLDSNKTPHFFSLSKNQEVTYDRWFLRLNTGKQITIYIAQTIDEDMEYLESMLREAIQETPVGYFDFQDTFIFANAPYSEGLDTLGVFSKKTQIIYFFPAGTTLSKRENFKNTFWHELGHAYWNQFIKTHDLEDRWFDAIAIDNHFVSSYAKTNIEEDFCETIAFYILDDTGKTYPALRARMSERYKILDEIFEQHPRLKHEMKKHLLLKRTVMGGLVLFNTGVGIYIKEKYLTGEQND